MNLNVSFLYKLVSFAKTAFWKNENIIYINSNKKRQNRDNIDEVIVKTRKYKWLICESNSKFGYMFYKIHLMKMKYNLYNILRNSNDSTSLVYSGFVSPMFSAYDGYCIGDARKITFVDLDSNTIEPYKIEYEKKYVKNEITIEKKDEISVAFECSYVINCVSNLDFKYTKMSGNRVNKKYLQNIYSLTKSLLDECLKNNVKRINLYIAAKQPISFVIGTAIQSYHPTVYIYEFHEGKYIMPLIIQEGKIER